jgi:hypothetical protein
MIICLWLHLRQRPSGLFCSVNVSTTQRHAKHNPESLRKVVEFLDKKEDESHTPVTEKKRAASKLTTR